MQKKILQKTIFTLFIVFSANVFSQNLPKDIESKLKIAKNLEDSIYLLNQAFEIIIEKKVEDAEKIALLISDLSQNANYQKGVAIAYSEYGMIYYTKGDFSKSIEFHLKSIKIKEKLNDEHSLAVSYNNIALVYNEKSEYEKAIEYYHKSLKIKEKFNDNDDIALIYNNIAMIYSAYGKDKKALEYFKKSYEIYDSFVKQNPDNFKYKNLISSTLFNIGAIYYNFGNLDTAIIVFKKAAEVFNEIDSKVYLGVCYSSIGTIYSEKELYKDAIEYHKKALNTLLETGDSIYLSSTYRDIADDYAKSQDMQNAFEYYFLSLNMSFRLKEIDEIKETSYILSKLYEEQKDYQNSLKYFKIFNDAKDSIFDLESKQIFEEIQAKYESEKINQQVSLLNQDKLKKEKKLNQLKVILIISFVILLLICFLAIFFYRKYKLNKKIKEILINQKEEILLKLNEYEAKQKTETSVEKYASSKLSETERDEIFKKINKYLDEVKVFLNEDITLPVLAKQLNVPTNILSQTINSKTNQNFNDFINGFRINEAKFRLLNSEYQNLTIEAIGKSVGFNSRTTFINAFKKITNYTPSEYKKNYFSNLS